MLTTHPVSDDTFRMADEFVLLRIRKSLLVPKTKSSQKQTLCGHALHEKLYLAVGMRGQRNTGTVVRCGCVEIFVY